MTIRVAIQYQVIANDDAIKASYYRLTNPMQQVESYVYDVIRSTVPKINLDDGAATYHRWNRPHPLTHACPAAFDHAAAWVERSAPPPPLNTTRRA